MSAASRTRPRPGRGAPGRRRIPRAERERQMVEAAERIFARRGFREASMDEIAAECAVTKPMLYAYFGSKEGLFAACGRLAGERFRGQLRTVAADRGLDPAERLWLGLRTIFARVAENRETWRLLYPPEGPAPGGPFGARAALNRAAMTDLVSALLRDAARDSGLAERALVHIEPLTHALVGATLGLASWSVNHPDEHPDLQAIRLMNLVWRGLEGLQAGNVWMPAGWTRRGA